MSWEYKTNSIVVHVVTIFVCNSLFNSHREHQSFLNISSLGVWWSYLFEWSFLSFFYGVKEYQISEYQMVKSVSDLVFNDCKSPQKICPMPRYALFVIQPTVGSGICLLWIEKHSTLCCWFNCTSLYSSFVGHAYIIVFLTWKTMKYVIKTPIIQSSCSMTSMKLSSQIKLV